MDCKLFLKEKADFFQRIYGLKINDLLGLQPGMEQTIEEKGFGSPFLIVPRGLTHAIIRKTYQKKIGVCYVYDCDLDNLKKVKHDRWPAKKSYFIRHGGHREAIDGDEELKLLSAEKILERKIKTMTSLEISQFGLEHSLITGAPVDIKSISLASGSRNSAGYVPGVDWRDGRVDVRWCRPSGSGDTLRSRLVAG